MPIATADGSWAVWWSGPQYLYQGPCDPMKGWGRFGVSQGQTNPIEYFANVGLGGHSPITGRENDQFGIGWFYNGLSGELGPIATNLLDIGESATGVEIY